MDWPHIKYVRLRPAMSIGDTGETGLHNLLFEVLDHSVREFEDGHGRLIHIDLLPKNGCRIRDGGTGFPPLDVNGNSLAEMILTLQVTPTQVAQLGLKI